MDLTVLVGLRLQNIALIDSLELEFQNGFTVFTGETGAGKSILVDALDCLLAGKNSSLNSRMIGIGSKISIIEGVFSINNSLIAWLKENSFDIDIEEIVLTRELKKTQEKYSSRCRLNGILINKNQIISLRPLLIDLTVQGQTHELGSHFKQLSWLDNIGKNSLFEIILAAKEAWIKWNLVSQSLKKELQLQNELRNQNAYHKDVLEDLQSANLKDPLEEQQLLKEQDRLSHGVRLQTGLITLLNQLANGFSDFPSISNQLSDCRQELKLMSHLDESLSNNLDTLNDCCFRLEELIDSLDKYRCSLDSDPGRLEQLQERLSLLKRLQKRYDLGLPELIIERDKIEESLSLKNGKSSIKLLENQESFYRAKRDQANLLLTDGRRRVADQFEARIMSYLRSLGLESARFEVHIESGPPSETGKDLITFFFSANPGQPLAPLSEVASGGEMSRFLLCLKTVLSEQEGSSTLFFDEIDIGVSGKTSAAIANLLKELSLHRQIFCITHQPLVASAADNHFSITKFVENGITNSKIRRLRTLQDRQNELVELAGGDLVEANAYIASLLDTKAA